MNRYLALVAGSALLVLTAISGALGDTAALLPNAIQYFMDNNGKPLSNGKVYFYIPGTTTSKTTWTTSDESVPQANPVLLGISGRPGNPIYGSGTYRQVVKDQFNNTIWDFNTASSGSGGGSTPSSEGVMVGTIIPWANTTLPSQYLYTAGQAISRTTYALLLTAITYNTTIICSGGNPSVTVSTTISDGVPIGAPVESSCFAPGTTVIAKSSGSLTMSNNATVSITTTAAIFPWGNGNGSTTFNVPDLRGRVLAGRDNMGGTAAGVLTSTYYKTPGGTAVNPDALNAVAGSQSSTLLVANLPPYTPTGTINITDPGHSHTGTVLAFTGPNNFTTGSSGNINNGGLTTSTATTGLNSSNVLFAGSAQGGTSTPHSIVQPSMTADYIIKALPDDSPSGPGVSSIGGMTGVIACGTNLICNANTISVTIPGIVDSTTTYTGGTVFGVLYNNGVVKTTAANTTTTKQYLSQTGDGTNSATPVFATIAGADVTGAVLSRTNDTNVTLTLGGSPNTALLNAASLTLGWTGTLALARGGCNAALTASNGGILWSNATQCAILAGTATANLPMLSGATATPSWATIAYPGSATSGGIPYFSSTTAMASSALLTANAIMLGGGAGTAPTVLGSLGTTTTLLHGNAAGAPTFGAVVSADMNITTTTCTNQFVTAISSGAIGTCTTNTLASAQHANQGTTTTVLHGNAAGNPSWSAVALSTDISGLGTGVATAAGNALSAAGGLTGTIASGTSALGTGAISSGTCATVVTTSATNTATTDVVLAGFNGDPTAVTGYIPSTSGMLTIISYPTANNVNFKVCNNTLSSITPGAITLNWRVVR